MPVPAKVDAPYISDTDLQNLYNQQQGNKPVPQAGENQVLTQEELNALGGENPAQKAIKNYSNWLLQNQGTPSAGIPSAANSAGGAGPTPPAGTPMHTQAPGMVPTGGIPQQPGRTGGQAAPPPMAVGGQGVIPSNVGVTPAAPETGAGSSLPQHPLAPAGGSNMRIINGPRIQDIQYGPGAGGQGVTTTAMRDVATGQTFVAGPNGQYYPAGTTPTSAGGQQVMPGMGFGNAQTNIVGAGLDAAAAANAGVPLTPVMSEALGRMRLAGVSPSSPVGQQMMNKAISDWNQSQTQLGVAQITAEPHNIAARAVVNKDDPMFKRREYSIKVGEEIRKEFGSKLSSEQFERMRAQRMNEFDQTYGIVPGSVPNAPMPAAAGVGGGGTVRGGGPALNVPGSAPTGGPASLPPGSPAALNQPQPAPAPAPAESEADQAARQTRALQKAPTGETEQGKANRLQKLWGNETYQGLYGVTTDANGAIKPITDTHQLLLNVFRQNKAEPGYAIKVLPSLMAEIQRTRPGDNLGDIASGNDQTLGAGQLAMRNIASVMPGFRESEEGELRAALSEYLGQEPGIPRIMRPIAFLAGGLPTGRVQRDTADGGLGGATYWGSGSRRVVPGSPFAQKIIAEMNAADIAAGKKMPLRRGRAGTED